MQVVGVDIGGTFTDVVLFDDTTGERRVTKVPSRPGAEEESVLQGLQLLGVETAQVQRLVHGTTVGTNAVLEHKGVPVGLVTTRGFRDVVEVGRGRRLVPASMFDPHFIRPRPLVPRHLRFEVTERLLPGGAVLTPLDEAEVHQVAEMLRQADIQAVAVCFLHSYANAMHEECAGAILAEALPGVHVSLSAHVVPEYREFERFTTTCLNAALGPIINTYVRRLAHRLQVVGCASHLYIMSSSGGMMTLEATGQQAVRTILSGPVGGVNGAVFLAPEAGFHNLITYDMGGTSTDVCLVRDLAPVTQTERVIAGIPVKMPQLEINTVGAGGGSIAWIDAGHILQVGPQSAGARPGPACYGLGGTEATVTDANAILGRLNPEAVLGNHIPLQVARARQAVHRLACRLGQQDLSAAAEGILRLAVAKMVNAIREITVEQGYDPREFVLLAMGGIGPMHAAEVAADLEVTRVIVPMHPGNLSAFGLLCSDLRRDYVRTLLTPVVELAPNTLEGYLRELRQAATHDLERDGFTDQQMRYVPALDLRYVGQAFELTVPFASDKAALDQTVATFHQQHARRYGHSDPDGAVEVVNLRLSSFGIIRKPRLPSLPSPTHDVTEAVLGTRAVYFSGVSQETTVYHRERLPRDAVCPGPAIVEEFGATTIVPPAWQAQVDHLGNLVLTKSDCM
jgi:N-methylhydantoinase A